ncbi:MAG: Peptidase S8/S53 subtilisin kexin sedolisin [Ignavibacteria bacterium]|nr:MAG: Peptidase S8/S53 subtilisin kexin sedolisin [Ignavibacteria bacterium]
MRQLVIIMLFISAFVFSQGKINYKLLNANNVRLGLQNIGNLNNKFGDGSGGGYWNMLNKDSVIVFDQGPWIIGKINNKIHIALSQWGTNFSPGPIINNKAAMQYKPEDSLKYRIYKISKGDNNTNKDYAEWPFEFGAPKTKDGKPKLYQGQTLWTVFNSYDPNSVYKKYWIDSLFIMPVEIHQLAYSKKGTKKDEVDAFSNTVFFEWIIINKGNHTIDSTYFSLWADIDFSNALENYPATDSINNICYLWTNKTNTQPAVGYTLLFGPAISSAGKTAVVKGVEKKGFTNLKVTSSHSFIENAQVPNSINDPAASRLTTAASRQQTWNLVRGLHLDGTKKIDPTNGNSTKFNYSGDPITDIGWLWKDRTGGEAGFNLFSGPFNMAPNDTHWVMMALVPALGKDYKESIAIMRNKVKLLKSMPYDSLAFGRNDVMVGFETEKEIPKEFSLKQNYPNPFNPSTVISYKLQAASHVTLKVYDVLGREIATLVNQTQHAGKYQIMFDASRLASGTYIYTLII